MCVFFNKHVIATVNCDCVRVIFIPVLYRSSVTVVGIVCGQYV